MRGVEEVNGVGDGDGPPDPDPDCIANISFSVTYSGNVCTYSSGP